MSSNDIAIKVENISKLYRIGMKQEMRDSFASTIFDVIKSPWKNYRKYRSLYKFDDIRLDQIQKSKDLPSDIILPVNDVSFSVRQGEVLGIIGKNGAGKSTLLKILCRITDPTSGFAEIRGRVSSLLEVGTGFHRELTGRENTYLNGTILGMTKKEVDRKFDEIVAFSGVEKFIDTPVKRYSSGMMVRLAFSVAAHLEPEILIVDEVLAVGDADFQKKCLDKMENVGQQGRTVLFVSHNMPAVTRLCSRTILLNHGKIIDDGPSAKVVKKYLTTDAGVSAARDWSNVSTAPTGKFTRILAVRVKTENGEGIDTIDIRHSFGIEMLWEVIKSDHVLSPHFSFTNESGDLVFVTIDLDHEWTGKIRPLGRFWSTAWVPGNLLAEGLFYVGCHLYDNTLNASDCGEGPAISSQIVDTCEGDSARGDYGKHFPGVVRPLLKWATKFEPAG
jgi:lipopolysaccharide transport system ATP-binding protein